MLNLNKLAKRPRVFQTVCGLTPQQFNDLLIDLEPLWTEAEYKRQAWPGRQRQIGGGDKAKLSLSEQLFMLLTYYRTYIGQVFLGLLMGVDDSTVSRRIRRLEPVLARVFRVPKRRIDLAADEVFGLIVDATEQETCRRPGSGYSGKQHQQTIKTQIHVTPDGLIKAVSASLPGNRHDKHLYDVSQTYIRGPDGKPIQPKKHGDLGYVGTACVTPCKKPKSRPLMMHERYHNRQLSPERIPVEHAICHLKQWQILADRFHNNLGRYNLIFRNIAGLRNFIQTS